MLEIYPAPALDIVCQPVTNFDETLYTTLQAMREILEGCGALGIAANQVGAAVRVFLMNTAENDDDPPVVAAFINPEVTPEPFSERVNAKEACLSFPGVSEWVERDSAVCIRYQDHEGTFSERHLTGLLAVCAQHELDHLNGLTMLDRVSPLKRHMMMKDLARTLTKLAAKRHAAQQAEKLRREQVAKAQAALAAQKEDTEKTVLTSPTPNP